MCWVTECVSDAGQCFVVTEGTRKIKLCYVVSLEPAGSDVRQWRVKKRPLIALHLVDVFLTVTDQGL